MIFDRNKRVKNVNALVADLHCCSINEVGYRLFDKFYIQTGLKQRRFHPGWMSDEEFLASFNGRFASVTKLCESFRSRTQPFFFFSPHDAKGFRSQYVQELSAQTDTAVNRAEQIIQRRFNVLGQKLEFGEQINWHLASGSQRSWPLKHWTQINISDSKTYGDIKPIWEINRLQHFFCLGRAYWWTGDKKYVQEFIDQFQSWYRENPAEMGINWQSNLEIALRSVSLIYAMQFFMEEISDGVLVALLKVLIHSGRHLEKNLIHSQCCMRNNHLIGDAAGLNLIAMFLPELKAASKWRNKSGHILNSEFDRQVFADGVNNEQAISYHRFVFYLFLLPTLVRKFNGEKIDDAVWTKIERMVEYVHWMIKPDGTLPLIGDSDDGRVVVFNDDELDDYRGMLAVGAALFFRKEFKLSAGKINEEIIWLLGMEGLKIWQGLAECASAPAAKVFPDGGYFIARSGWNAKDSMIVLRNGPHADHHAHADQLHIEVHAAGKDILVDSGTYRYNGDPVARNFFRGTFAHNTTVVDGESQAIPHRSFRWLKAGRPTLSRTYLGPKIQWISGGHTAYERYVDPVTHYRSILCSFGDYYLIVDHFSARTSHCYETLFHFAEGIVDLTPEGMCVFEHEAGGGAVLMSLYERRQTISVCSGQTEPTLQGWISRRYGERHPIPTISFRNEATGSWRQAYLLKTFEARPGKVKITESDSLGWIVQEDGYIDSLVGNKLGTASDLRTNCDCSLLRLAEGKENFLFLTQGTSWEWRDHFSLNGRWNHLEMMIDPVSHTVKIMQGQCNELELFSRNGWSMEKQGL